jgi:hypothetical protein
MRNFFSRSALAVLALMAFSTCAAAQVDGLGGSSLKLTNEPGGPAPRHSFDGTWVGPTNPRRIDEPPQFTSLGQERMKLNKPEGTFLLAGTNDPVMRTCDPMGFPRHMIVEVRGVGEGEMMQMTFASLPGRMIVLTQWQQMWRQIWTDGRALPTNAGAPGGPETRYFGYSVGRWEADNVFVVDTVGLADGMWINKFGFPHTAETRVRERYTRSDHNNLELTITVEDPKLYVKPFLFSTNHFKWLPDQKLDAREQLCVPSRMLEYLRMTGQ